MTQRFTIAGSTLSLLHIGEHGVVTRTASADAMVSHKLSGMGIVPGVSITLVQRSPSYLIQVGNHQFALSQTTAKAIYLRVQPATLPTSLFDQLNQWAIACLKKLMIGKSHSAQPVSSIAIGR